MSQENQRYYIFVSWKNGRDATKIHEELVNAEGEHALSLSTVRRWVAKFKDGETQVDDRPRSGRPREAVTQEKIAKVQELITNDPHITTQILEDEIGISHDRIVYILHNELNLHKVCAKWIPHKLSADHKKNEWKFRSNCWKYSKKAIITSLLGMKHGCISSPFRAKKAIRFG